MRGVPRDVMKFWLALECDGFRVDLASSPIKNNPNAIGLRRLRQGFRAWIDRDYPEFVLVSEWIHPIKAIDSVYHIDFMIYFGDFAFRLLVGPGYAPNGKARRPHVFFERAGEGEKTAFLRIRQKHYAPTKGRGYIALPTGDIRHVSATANGEILTFRGSGLGYSGCRGSPCRRWRQRIGSKEPKKEAYPGWTNRCTHPRNVLLGVKSDCDHSRGARGRAACRRQPGRRG